MEQQLIGSPLHPPGHVLLGHLLLGHLLLGHLLLGHVLLGGGAGRA